MILNASFRIVKIIACTFSVSIVTGCGLLLTQPSVTRPTVVGDHTRGRNLLYVAYGSTSSVGVFTFPGLKERGRLRVNFGGIHGLCSNAAGDVFVPFLAGYGGTDEFAHGGVSPIQYLSFPYQYAVGCAVNPSTGTLAVIGGFQGYGADVTVYHYKPHLGWRFGKTYSLPGFYDGGYCGYDATDDLFCDGTTSKSGGFSLAELTATSSTFAKISLSQQISAPGQIQWDGTDLAIGDAGVSPSVVYRFTINGSSLSETGETILNGSIRVEQFWIFGDKIIAADSQRVCESNITGCVAVFRYPAGGAAQTRLPVSAAHGIAVSVAP